VKKSIILINISDICCIFIFLKANINYFINAKILVIFINNCILERLLKYVNTYIFSIFIWDCGCVDLIFSKIVIKYLRTASLGRYYKLVPTLSWRQYIGYGLFLQRNVSNWEIKGDWNFIFFNYKYIQQFNPLKLSLKK